MQISKSNLSFGCIDTGIFGLKNKPHLEAFVRCYTARKGTPIAVKYFYNNGESSLNRYTQPECPPAHCICEAYLTTPNGTDEDSILAPLHYAGFPGAKIVKDDPEAKYNCNRVKASFDMLG